MKNDNYKKYLYIGLTAFGVVAACIVLFFFFLRIGEIFQGINSVFTILMPIVYGIVLAYLLLPLYRWLFKRFHPLFAKRAKNEKSAVRSTKTVSTLISMFVAVVVIGGLIALVIPQVLKSLYNIAMGLPQTFQNIIVWVNNAFSNHDYLRNLIVGSLQNAKTYVNDLINSGDITSDFSVIASSVFNGVKSVVSVVINVAIGFIIAIYVLNSTKLFAAQAKKLTYSIFKVNTANTIIHNFRYTNKLVSNFINGRLLESLIVGVLCFIAMSIFGMPYSLLISVVVGVANIIPVFGPFIGAIPSVVLILTVNPITAFWFIVLIIVLQILDGYIIGPKISSNMTGISSFWVMFALLLFGGLFGIWGMLLGVPVFAVIKTLFAGLVNKKLKKKNMPVTTVAYTGSGYVSAIEPSEDDSENADETGENKEENKTEEENESPALIKRVKGWANKFENKFKRK